MNKRMIFGFIVVLFLGGCSILESNNPKKEVVQEKQERDYIDPYLNNIK